MPIKEYVLKEKPVNMLCEPVVTYQTQSALEGNAIEHRIYGKLYTHQAVFQKFAEALNNEFGTNIPR